MSKYNEIEIAVGKYEFERVFKINPGYNLLRFYYIEPIMIAQKIYNIFESAGNRKLNNQEYTEIINILKSIHPFLNEVITARHKLRSGIKGIINSQREINNLYIVSAYAYYIMATKSKKYGEEMLEKLKTRLVFTNEEEEYPIVVKILEEAFIDIYRDSYFGQIVFCSKYLSYFIDKVLLIDDLFTRRCLFNYMDYCLSVHKIIDPISLNNSYNLINEIDFNGIKTDFLEGNIAEESKRRALIDFFKINSDAIPDKIFAKKSDIKDFEMTFNEKISRKAYIAEDFFKAVRIEIMVIINRNIHINKCSCGKIIVKNRYCGSCGNNSVKEYRARQESDIIQKEIQLALNRTISNRYFNKDKPNNEKDKYDTIIAFIHIFKNIFKMYKHGDIKFRREIFNKLTEDFLLCVEKSQQHIDNRVYGNCLDFYRIKYRDVFYEYSKSSISKTQKKYLNIYSDALKK